MNKCIISGRLTRDAMFKKTTSGKSVCSFTLAVEKRGSDVADYVDFVAWEKTAEVIDQYVKQGDKILVIGHIEKRKYENKDGQTVYTTEVIVESFEFMGKKKADAQESQENGRVVDADYNEKPHSKYSEMDTDDDPDFNTGPLLDIKSDDLPF